MKEAIKKEWQSFGTFWVKQAVYWNEVGMVFLGWLVVIKDRLAKLMYLQRGRFSQPVANTVMAGLFFVVILFSSQLENLVTKTSASENGGSSYLLASDGQAGANTLISNSSKGEITEYRVQEGDTVAAIAQKFGVTMDTIIWENNLKSVDDIKPGEILRILPISGVRYKVSRGETIYSIAKKLQADPQSIIDYPFNSFANDETFELAAGQELIVPDGIKPNEISVDTQKVAAKAVAPIPGVVGEGKFIWPTTGVITQRYSWYHPAVDIANPTNPPVVAAATGTVIVAGWNAGGYGNYVIIDHGNGYQTLYGHMLNNSLLVKAGDKVTQGQRIGTMGSTGRSTGTHTHFEIRLTAGGTVNPLTLLP